MAEKKRIDHPTGTETVGHEWDGIEELNTPLPRWWLWTLYATIIFSIVYVILYPAIPMLNSATAGTLGWSSRGQLEAEMNVEAKRRAPIMTALATTPIDQLSANENLMKAAVEGGRSAFKVHCVQCHGSGAAGSKGYPNLNDDDWLWGGDLKAIEYTIAHGIRNPVHDQTRTSQMPAFGRDQLLDAKTIADVVSHVRVISGQEKASTSSQRGAVAFAANCAICHGANGTGDRLVGAPNLADAIWLYGGDRASITQSVHESRQGVMPRWNERLDATTIKMLAAYVHSLGGGEASPDKAGSTAAATTVVPAATEAAAATAK